MAVTDATRDETTCEHGGRLIRKFDGGRDAILCSHCRLILGHMPPETHKRLTRPIREDALKKAYRDRRYPISDAWSFGEGVHAGADAVLSLLDLDDSVKRAHHSWETTRCACGYVLDPYDYLTLAGRVEAYAAHRIRTVEGDDR